MAVPQFSTVRYGPYCDEKDEELSTEYPFISGYTSSRCAWKNVEPQSGEFNWTSCRGDMEFALRQGKFLLLSPHGLDWP